MKKTANSMSLAAFVRTIGRCERIRTFDPLHPMQVRYQAAPHTGLRESITRCVVKPTVQAGHVCPLARHEPDAAKVALCLSLILRIHLIYLNHLGY